MGKYTVFLLSPLLSSHAPWTYPSASIFCFLPSREHQLEQDRATGERKNREKEDELMFIHDSENLLFNSRSQRSESLKGVYWTNVPRERTDVSP